MNAILCLLCIISIAASVWAWGKVFLLRRALEELCIQFADRLREDTNVGISVSMSDKKFRRFAALLDRQLKVLRKEQIRYRQGDKELKAAVTNISHDLRTPLTAICGYLDLMKEEEVSQTVREYLFIVENRALALKDLTEELFRYSVILSSERYEERETLSLNLALEECIAGYYGALKEAGIDPVVKISETAVKRNLNRQAVSRILSNLISNAIKYSDGDLFVELKKDGSILFRNRAKKLDEVLVGHLFDRFYTVESGRDAAGLGLSIAKTLAEEMGGALEAAYKNGSLYLKLYFSVDKSSVCD